MIEKEHWAFIAAAKQVFKVADVLVVNHRDDSCFLSLASSHIHALPFKVNVSRVKVHELVPAKPEPV
ncbi:MAG: hypothetical protein HY564_01690 [Candidatus Jacksonbacteria bacterium]|nr:hypothetical protein [Candidatus Jacksonbacteria bacterium]